MREFLKGLELEDGLKLSAETIDKIMSEYGKSINKSNEELNSLKQEIQSLRENSKNAEELQLKYDELTKSIEEKEAKAKAEEEDKLLTQNINNVYGDKIFTSEYARIGLTNDIKSELNKPENKGKGIEEIFNTLTKDKTDIFTSPNQLKDMPSMGESEQENNIKQMPYIW